MKAKTGRDTWLVPNWKYFSIYFARHRNAEVTLGLCFGIETGGEDWKMCFVRNVDRDCQNFASVRTHIDANEMPSASRKR